MSPKELIEECMADIRVALAIAESRTDLWRLQPHLVRIQCQIDAIAGTAVPPDSGPWEVSEDGRRMSSDNFDHDVSLTIAGDFYNDESRRLYGLSLAHQLSGTVFERRNKPIFLEVSPSDPGNDLACNWYRLNDAEQELLEYHKANFPVNFKYTFKTDAGSGIGTTVHAIFGNEIFDITDYESW